MGSYPDVFYKTSASLPIQILVVEDDIQLADVLKKALTTDWLDVQVANHGDEVKEMVRVRNFKLILLDIKLPGKDGFAILEELKANPYARKIPVMMLTNQDGQDRMSRAFKLGASDYFIKIDIDFARLRAIVHKYILEQTEPVPLLSNALILHGTDFSKTQKQHLNNWFPWLKTQLEALKYYVWVPELPQAWQPDLQIYWYFLKGFYYNAESVLVGHSSGGAATLGILNELDPEKKIGLAISVAGFYKDEGWNCQKLFTKNWDWEKIKEQATKILVIGSKDDPAVKQHQTDYIAKKLKLEPVIFENKGHFNLKSSPNNAQFPELLDLIKQYAPKV